MLLTHNFGITFFFTTITIFTTKIVTAWAWDKYYLLRVQLDRMYIH